MKTGLVIGIVALVSLGFAATAWAMNRDHCSMADRGERMQARVAEKLALDDTQKLKFAQFAEQLQAMRAASKAQHDATRTEALALLDQPTLDRDQALRLFESRKQATSTSASAMINAFAEFSDSLNVEQKAQLKAMIEKRMNRGFGHFRHGKDQQPL